MPDRLHKEGESAKAYGTFEIFFAIPAGQRTIAELAKKVSVSLNSLYKWQRDWRWDERIDAACGLALTIYERETAKAAATFAAKAARRRQEIMDKQFDVLDMAVAKSKEVLQFVTVYDAQTSKDGKTIIIKSNPNVRLGDAMRLIVGSNVALAQIDKVANPGKPGKPGHKGDGSPAGGPESPVVEIFLDGGDGVALPIQQMPEPDELEADFHPEEDDGSTPTP